MAKQKVKDPPPEDVQLLMAGDVFVKKGSTITQAPPGPSLQDVIQRAEKKITK